MASEIALAESYGLFYPVGDTTGAPGLSRGLRSVAIYKQFAEAISSVQPECMGNQLHKSDVSFALRTLTRVAPQLKVFGCCHEVFATQKMLVEYRCADICKSKHQPVMKFRSTFWVSIISPGWIRQLIRVKTCSHCLPHHLTKPGILRSYTRKKW